MGIKEYLRQVDMFNGLDDEQLEHIAAICHEERYNSGDLILKENEPTTDLYIIQQGGAQVFLGEQGEGATLLLTLGQGQVFGEMALVDQGLRSATVRCIADDTILYVIPRDDLIHLCETDPDMGYKIMRNIAADLSFKLRHRNLAWH